MYDFIRTSIDILLNFTRHFFVKFVEPNRTLYIYTDHTDLVQTQIGGDTKKDLLKEVISTICLKEEHSLSNVN